MISGFDYGTSNCAIGVIDDEANKLDNALFTGTGKPLLLPLEAENVFLPSCLYALGRELICENVARSVKAGDAQMQYRQSRAFNLEQASRLRREESIAQDEQCLFFGRAGFEQYFNNVGHGYFVKSVKSFLGASGVREDFIAIFEDIVTAMMLHVKHRAQSQCQSELTHTVIGRPVNFQGLNAQKSNAQALSILEVAAKRAGFKSVEFLYEPVAAGFDYEKQMTNDKKVLVVDIGGGTSDCAMLCMGPSFVNKTDRKDDFLGHTGERVGGNDLDIQLTVKALMPLLGMNSQLKNGLPMPTQIFRNAASTNDVGAQAEFNKMETGLHIAQLLRDTKQPQLLQRFSYMRENKSNHQLVNVAERAKIALSTQSQFSASLDFLEAGLNEQLDIQQLEQAVQRPLKKVVNLMRETISQAGVNPDLIYLTGGSSKSPLVRHAISQQLGVEVIEGDHFGSVANGLTVWADRIYR